MDTSTITKLWQTVKEEEAQREAIRQSSEFQALQIQIDEAQDLQEKMLTTVANHSPDYESAKRELIQYMKVSGQRKIGNITAVVRNRKEVNIARLLRVLEGDIDNFCVLAKVQQNTLKDFAKTDARKNELLECIESAGEDITDVEILPQ